MGGIVGLGGGIGAARLWEALAVPARGGRGPLTLVLNTANDLRLHGLRICPDIDTVLYALSGRLDAGRGWGLRDDSFRCLAALGGLGGAAWFRLGDLDLATHLYRTGLLREGASLTEVTRRLAESSGITARILPMSDDDVTTMVVGVDGRLLHYQEYLVREQATPAVRGVRFEGIGQARPAPGVLAAIESATHIVLGPASPVAGLLPILGLPGVTETLRQHRDRVTAISPIVAGAASTGPEENPGEKRRSRSRAALLASVGLPATASGAARLYRDVCTRFVYDPADRDEAAGIADYGLEPVPAPLPAAQDADPAPLLAAILGA
jgi:LPPG:FO 2-phospho-L-lactate transferase